MQAVFSELRDGRTIRDISHTYGISTRTLYRWRAKLVVEQQSARERLRSLEAEHRLLQKQFAELTLDYTTLRVALMRDVKGDC
jgi:transposase-like protein